MSLDAVVVGLGNPGPRYSFTRHNIAWLALDVLARELGASFSPASKLKAESTEVEWSGKKLLLLKPQTFMNLSGESLRALYEKRSDLKELPLIVLHDEVDIEFGKVRVKFGGGDAGHNGLRSIRACLGHGEFFRVRMGVGKPPFGNKMDLADWVLQNFPREDEQVLSDEIERSLDVVEALLTKDLNTALNVAARQ